ncbi:MAG TPA: hypothetical protein VFO37_04765 [Chitinophagaceae bacterium]|nr:hypothetical protein [Chitinophagaceae bacterium]
MMFDKVKFQWQPLVELSLVLVTILGSTIPLYLHTDNKLEASIQAIRQDIAVVRQESAAQTARTDKLYEMFIDLLKERK